MSRPVIFVGPTTLDVRRAVRERLQRFSTCAEQVTIFGASGSADRAWRAVLRDEAQTTWLPRFAEFDRWCVDAVSLCSQKPIRWVEPADRQFMLRDVLGRLRSKLGSLPNLAGSHTFLRELDALIADLRRAGVDRMPGYGDWARDLQLILDDYDNCLRINGGVDIECAPRLFAAQCERTPNLPRCAVFDFTIHLPPVRWEGMLALASRVEEAVATFVLPDLEEPPGSLEELVEQTQGSASHRALSLWNAAFPAAEFVVCGQATERTRAVVSLFDWQRPRAPQPQHVTLTGAHTARDELANIAAHIRANSNSLHELERVTVVLPDPVAYNGPLEAAFAEHGVPFRIERSRPHATYPLVRRTLRLFDLAEDKWPVDTLTDIYGDGLFRLSAENHALDIHRLRNHCNGARISNLDDLEKCAPTLQDYVNTNDVEAVDISPKDLECIRFLHDACARLEGKLTVGEWADAVLDLLDQSTGHLREKAAIAGAANETIEREASLQVAAVEAAVQAVLRRAERWMLTKERPARDWLEWLRFELDTTHTPLVPRPFAAVRVVGPMQLLSGVRSTVYFAGLNEGDWPSAQLTGTLVARHQHELAPIREHLPDPVQLAVHQLGICIAEADALHLSYANWREGRERLRSPLLEDLTVTWPALPSLPMPAASTSRAGVLASLACGDFHVSETAGIDLDHLQTLRRIHDERRDDEKIGVYDGVLDLDDNMASLPMLDSTRLKNYAQCPIKYFFRYVLNIRSPQPLADDVQGQQSGITIHKILERFNSEYLGSLEDAAAWEAMSEIARQEVERLGLRPVLIEAELNRLLGRIREVAGGVLGAVLQTEIEQRAGTSKKPAFAQAMVPFRQSDFELPAGLRDSLEAKFRLQLGGQSVQGVIDRIDVDAAGTTVAVIDYKTEHPGFLADFPIIDAGLDFQLTLYLLAARKLFEEKGNRPALAAAYFSIRDARYLCGIGEAGTLGRNVTQKGPGALAQQRSRELPTETFDAWLDGVAERVGEIGGHIARGRFNLTVNRPEEAGCRFCDYATICRFDKGLQPRRHAAHVGSREVYMLQPLISPEEGSDVE